MSHPALPSQEQGPYRSVRIRRTMDTMSMYLDVLAGSLRSWVDELTAPELVRYARACKEALESPACTASPQTLPSWQLRSPTTGP